MTKLEDEVDKLVEEYLPTPYPDQNMGLLPDESDFGDDMRQQENSENEYKQSELKQAILSLIASQGNLDKPKETPSTQPTADALSEVHLAKKLTSNSVDDMLVEFASDFFGKSKQKWEHMTPHQRSVIHSYRDEVNHLIADAEREARVDELTKFWAWIQYEGRIASEIDLHFNGRLEQLTKGNIE